MKSRARAPRTRFVLEGNQDFRYGSGGRTPTTRKRKITKTGEKITVLRELIVTTSAARFLSLATPSPLPPWCAPPPLRPIPESAEAAHCVPMLQSPSYNGISLSTADRGFLVSAGGGSDQGRARGRRPVRPTDSAWPAWPDPLPHLPVSLLCPAVSLLQPRSPFTRLILPSAASLRMTRWSIPCTQHAEGKGGEEKFIFVISFAFVLAGKQQPLCAGERDKKKRVKKKSKFGLSSRYCITFFPSICRSPRLWLGWGAELVHRRSVIWGALDGGRTAIVRAYSVL